MLMTMKAYIVQKNDFCRLYNPNVEHSGMYTINFEDIEPSKGFLKNCKEMALQQQSG